jgi:uncharacterized protein YbjT (DUF2867 family)
VVSRTPNGAAFSGQTAVQLREIMAQRIFLGTGATGATGGYAVERLLERGHPVRALAHREDDRSKQLQDFAGTNDLVETIGGRPATTLEAFIDKHRAAFA